VRRRLQADLDAAAGDLAKDKPARSQIIDLNRPTIVDEIRSLDVDVGARSRQVRELDSIADQEISDAVAVEVRRRIAEAVRARPAGEGIGAGAADEHIIAAPSVEYIVALQSGNLVAYRGADDRIWSAITRKIGHGHPLYARRSPGISHAPRVSPRSAFNGSEAQNIPLVQ
jgi:hypothetical protein